MATDRYFTRNGATIAYEFTGSGRPVGYAHGVFLSRAAVRRMQVFDFDRIASGRSLLTYDQRGHGDSTGRPVAEDYEFANVADDLLGLMDAEGIDEPIDFTGSSLGVATALYAALAAPERFRRLVLVIPPVAWETGQEPARKWYLDAADAIDARGAAAWRKEWADSPPLPIFADFPKADMNPEVPDELLPHLLRGIGNSDLPDPGRLATLPHPTLILLWDRDPLHPVDTAQRLHETIPDSTLHVAHTVDDVQTWTQRTIDFLADAP